MYHFQMKEYYLNNQFISKWVNMEEKEKAQAESLKQKN